MSADRSRIELFAGTGEPGTDLDPDGDPKESQFNRPTAVAAFPDGRALIVDSESHRILIVNAEGTQIEPFAGTGEIGDRLDLDPRQTQLNAPRGVAVFADNRVLIADSLNNRVLIVNSEGTEIRPFAGTGERGGYLDEDPARTQLKVPIGLAAAPERGKKDCVIL